MSKMLLMNGAANTGLYKVVTENGESRPLPKASAERVARLLRKARKGWYPAMKATVVPVERSERGAAWE